MDGSYTYPVLEKIAAIRGSGEESGDVPPSTGTGLRSSVSWYSILIGGAVAVFMLQL